MEDLTAAWLAGLFEGEGCISLTGKYSVSIAINMTDEDVIRSIQQRTGVGRLHGPYHYGAPGSKPIFSWAVGHQDAVRLVLTAIRQWVGTRRAARIDAALERLTRVRRHGFCRRGHLMSGDNLYIAPGCGLRICRECATIRGRARTGTEKRKAWDRARDKKPHRLAQKRAAQQRFRMKHRPKDTLQLDIQF
jgi:hypothetical protein